MLDAPSKNARHAKRPDGASDGDHSILVQRVLSRDLGGVRRNRSEHGGIHGDADDNHGRRRNVLAVVHQLWSDGLAHHHGQGRVENGRVLACPWQPREPLGIYPATLPLGHQEPKARDPMVHEYDDHEEYQDVRYGGDALQLLKRLQHAPKSHDLWDLQNFEEREDACLSAPKSAVAVGTAPVARFRGSLVDCEYGIAREGTDDIDSKPSAEVFAADGPLIHHHHGLVDVAHAEVDDDVHQEDDVGEDVEDDQMARLRLQHVVVAEFDWQHDRCVRDKESQQHVPDVFRVGVGQPDRAALLFAEHLCKVCAIGQRVIVAEHATLRHVQRRAHDLARLPNHELLLRLAIGQRAPGVCQPWCSCHLRAEQLHGRTARLDLTIDVGACLSKQLAVARM